MGKTTEADGGPIIFVNQPEVTDGWTAEEVADFRAFLKQMAPVWRGVGDNLLSSARAQLACVISWRDRFTQERDAFANDQTLFQTDTVRGIVRYHLEQIVGHLDASASWRERELARMTSDDATGANGEGE